MKSRDALARKVEVPGARIATPSAAVLLRLGSSLDVATVAQEAADSARGLTGMRYCLVVAVDEAGEFVTSGLTPEEHREMAGWPDGPRLFAYLRGLPGSFRLAGKEDAPEFSAADEEMLELFASQAAAIVNARARRQERRARPTAKPSSRARRSAAAVRFDAAKERCIGASQRTADRTGGGRAHARPVARGREAGTHAVSTSMTARLRPTVSTSSSSGRGR